MSVVGKPDHRSRWLPGGYQVAIVLVGVIVAGILIGSIGRLAWSSWEKYGWGIPGFYIDNVFGSSAVREALRNTFVVAAISCSLATLIAVTLAWLNERTDASMKTIGRVIPLVPFLMPALSLPIGWLILASPRVGLLNVLAREWILNPLGVHMETGPLSLFSWPGIVFIYTVPLVSFAYLVIAAAIRNLDPGIEEAGKMAGANPLTILFRLVVPAVRPALINAFLVCMIPGLTMLTIPLVIGGPANVPFLSVHILKLVKGRFPAEYAEAFLIGVMLVIPVLLVWFIQRRYAARGTSAVIGGRFSGASRIRLGKGWRLLGRSLFVAYMLIAVALPLLALVYLSGVTFWQPSLPDTWNPISNMVDILGNPRVQAAILNSVRLGLLAGGILVVSTFILSYGQRLFPRLAPFIDAMTKGPGPIANVLLAIAVLLTFGGPPFRLGGTAALLLVGYFIIYLPFASVASTSAQQQIGQNLIEASRMSGASQLRTLRSIAAPLSKHGLLGGFILVFVLVIGDVNVSLLLASANSLVIGWIMYDSYEFGTLPVTATMALIVTIVALVCVGIMMALTNRDRT